MAETSNIQEVNAKELNDELNSNNRPVLINALDEEDYMAKRIPGSINVPADKATVIKSVIPDRSQDIVVYCANSDCTASPQLAGKLTDLNYGNVRDFEAGIAGWERAGYKLIGAEA